MDQSWSFGKEGVVLLSRSRVLAAMLYKTLCHSEPIAPHIHVLYRDIPFILNIIAPHMAQASLSTASQSHLVLNIIAARTRLLQGLGRLLGIKLLPEFHV